MRTELRKRVQSGLFGSFQGTQLKIEKWSKREKSPKPLGVDPDAGCGEGKRRVEEDWRECDGIM